MSPALPKCLRKVSRTRSRKRFTDCKGPGDGKSVRAVGSAVFPATSIVSASKGVTVWKLDGDEAVHIAYEAS